MKNYKFRLEVVLKVRKVKEEICKQQLGFLISEKQIYLNEIEVINQNIKLEDLEISKSLREGIKAAKLKFYPEMHQAHKHQIIEIEKKIKNLDVKIEEKKDELIKKRAELKLIENLKEKELLAWKIQVNRKENLKIEELVSIWERNKEQS